MNRLIALLSTVSLLVLITACGSVPPAPVDRFYRLQPVSVSSASKAMKNRRFFAPVKGSVMDGRSSLRCNS